MEDLDEIARERLVESSENLDRFVHQVGEPVRARNQNTRFARSQLDSDLLTASHRLRLIASGLQRVS